MAITPEQFLELQRLLAANPTATMTPDQQDQAVVAPYQSQATDYRNQATALDQQAAQPRPQPQGFKQNLIKGLQAGMESFGRYGAPGGYEGQEALRQQEYDKQQAGRVAQAKDLRMQAQQQQELGQTAVGRQQSNRVQTGQLEETKRLREIQQRQQDAAEAAAKQPHYTPVQPGQPVMKTEPGQTPTFETAPGVKPVTRSNYQSKTVTLDGKPVDVFVDVDPDSPTAQHAFYRGEDVTDKISHYERPAASAVYNVGGDASKVAYIADQLGLDASSANRQLLIGTDKKLQAQVTDELARRGTTIDALTAQTRQLAQTAKDLMPSFDKAILQIKSPEFQAKLGPIMGRWNQFQTGTIGAGDPDFARLHTVVDLLKSGTLRAHFGARGGEGLLARFDALSDSGKMSPDVLAASLEGMRDFLNDTYVKPRFNAPPRPETQGAQPQGGKPPADPMGLRKP